MDYNHAIQRVGEVIDAAGVAIMFVGSAIAAVAATVRLARHDVATYRRFRQQLGQAILLGLELLVAGDIVRTVAAQPTLTSIAVLGGIVLIRTFLSFSLEVELTGRWPWQSGSSVLPPEEPPPPRRPGLRDQFLGLYWLLGLGLGVGTAGWRSTRQVLTAAAVFPVLLRSSARMAPAVVPVTLTPFWLRQLLKAAKAELLIARPKPPPKPAGAYLAHALNAAESRLEIDGRGRGDLVGKAVGVKDARGRAPNCPGLIVTPCCFRQAWNALSLADAVAVALALVVDVAPALLLPLPPQPASISVTTSTGSAPRMRNRRRVVPPFM